MINIKEFDSSLKKIEKISYKCISIYNISYITIKKINDYENINSVNPLYLIIGKADGYIEENNRNNLVFTSTDGNKEVLAKFTKLWDEIKHPIETINEGKKSFIKIKLNSNDDLPLNEMLKFHMLTVIVRSVFAEDGKNYPQVFFR